ncbi:MAG: RNase adapter RapZ [Actinomycetota bacterium]
MNAPSSAEKMRFTIITGLSGAGRSEAAKCLEDLGYFVIDNLPTVLIEKMAELMAVPGATIKQVALVVDSRGGEFIPALQRALKQLSARGIEHRILFLEASDESLVRRFVETRRRHPLTDQDRVIEGITEERQMLEPLREVADLIVDTSGLNVHELRDKIRSLFGVPDPSAGISAHVISFGYKHGLPLDADLVFDCRFLSNPHWLPELRALNGTDPPVRDYVLRDKNAQLFLQGVREMIDVMLPGFVKEGRHYLTIAVGCTGGKHRSVAVGAEIAAYLGELGFPSTVVHRDLDKE